VAEDKKRIPYPQMIYFGDGETDIPCMKIVKMFGGHAVAVYNPASPKKKAFAKTLRRQGRVNFTVPANYTEGSKTYKVVCAIIDKIIADYQLKRLEKSR
jgi:hydroxymethylpyrimidine pyrophosphatase-like HAD family hydrolase